VTTAAATRTGRVGCSRLFLRQTRDVFQCRRSTDSLCYVFISKVGRSSRQRPARETDQCDWPRVPLGATYWTTGCLRCKSYQGCVLADESDSTQPGTEGTRSTLDAIIRITSTHGICIDRTVVVGLESTYNATTVFRQLRTATAPF